jgi:hypothetical protein
VPRHGERTGDRLAGHPLTAPRMLSPRRLSRGARTRPRCSRTAVQGACRETGERRLGSPRWWPTSAAYSAGGTSEDTRHEGWNTQHAHATPTAARQPQHRCVKRRLALASFLAALYPLWPSSCEPSSRRLPTNRMSRCAEPSLLTQGLPSTPARSTLRPPYGCSIPPHRLDVPSDSREGSLPCSAGSRAHSRAL